MASDQTPQVDRHPLHDVMHRLADTLEELLHHVKLAMPHAHETHGTPVVETIAADAAVVAQDAAKVAAVAETVAKDA